MKIIPVPSDGGFRRLIVEVEWGGVAGDYDNVVATYAQSPLPGFRQGKAPRAVVEERFQASIRENFSQRVAGRLGREALRQAGTEALGPIEVDAVEFAKEKQFRFRASYRPMPEIPLPDLRALPVQDNGQDPRDQISARLLDLVRFDVPDELIRRERGDASERDNSGEAGWKAAADRVKLMLILKKIARSQGIDVSEADVEERVKKKAVEFGKDFESLRRELRQGEGWPRLKDMLLAEETLTYLLELNPPG